MAYVYRHIRLDKNEPFYIGIGSDDNYEFKRAYDFSPSRRNIIWNKIYNKAKIEVDIVVFDISDEAAKLKEIEFIKLYGRRDIGNGSLVNKTDGGDYLPGILFSDEHRRKLSEAAKKRVITDEQKEKLRLYRIGKSSWNKGLTGKANCLYGRKVSDEIRLKGSLAKIGSKNPMHGVKGEKHHGFKGVVCVYVDDVKIGEYIGVHECAKMLKLSATKISACLNGRRNKHGGYTFKRNESCHYG